MNCVMNLKSTIDDMCSADYIDRFKAEYMQTKIRYEKLKEFCNRIEAANRDERIEMPKHDCSLALLREQQKAMGEYLHILELRAIIENIALSDCEV